MIVIFIWSVMDSAYKMYNTLSNEQTLQYNSTHLRKFCYSYPYDSVNFMLDNVFQ